MHNSFVSAIDHKKNINASARVKALLNFTPGIDLLEWMKIDDPVGCFPVHGIAGVWGLVAVGLFAETVSSDNTIVYGTSTGVFKGGKIMFMGAQIAACFCILVWSMTVSLIEVRSLSHYLF